MDMKKLSMQVDLDSFIPATDEEKEYIVTMRPSSTFFQDGVKRFMKNKVAVVSLIIIVIITLSSILIPMFWPYSYDQMLGVQTGRPVDPSFKNLEPFEYGRSEIAAIIYSLPDMLMVILLASVLKQTLAGALDGTILEHIGSNIISLFVVFALLYWVSMARLIRGQILSLREQEYVMAAEATGAKPGWVIRKHLLPNCISVIIISTALQIPNAIFTESYLSFLGLGVNAPMPSLGSLASDALNGLASHTFLLIIPAIVISLIVLSLNLMGDGLRDAFDSKLDT